MRPVVLLRLLAAALAALAMGLCVSTYSTFGHTWDEPEHLASGLMLLDRGVYLYDLEHPPIGRVAIALGPWLGGLHSFGEPGPSGEQEGRDLMYREGNYDTTLTRARLGALAFLPILLAGTWAFARRLAGDAVATLAVLFLATTPTVLGHAGVAALDVPGAAMCLLALLTLVSWLEAPTWRRAAALGLAAGLAVGTKFSALPFIGVSAAGLMLARLALGPAPGSGPGRGLPRLSTGAVAGGAAVAALAAAVALFVAYAGQVGQFVLGIGALLKHNQGHLSFLLGETRTMGWWYFYLVALAVKTTLPLLVLGVAGLALLARRAVRERDWRLAAPTVFFAAILGFCSAYSHINIGVRHVIVLYPLLAVAAAYALTRLWAGRARFAARAAAVALVAWQASAVVTAHPDYLPYFNELVRRPEAVLIDSDLDWGQDMRRLEKELRRRNVQQLSFVFRGTEDWIREDLPPFTFLPPDLPTTGWVAVDLLAKFQLSRGGDGYAWLDAYRPVMRVGKTIDLYYIPEAPPGARGSGTRTNQNDAPASAVSAAPPSIGSTGAAR